MADATKALSPAGQKALRQHVHNLRNLAGLLLGAVNTNKTDKFAKFYNEAVYELDVIGTTYLKEMGVEDAVAASVVVPREKQDGTGL